jgi:hypothetical protein
LAKARKNLKSFDIKLIRRDIIALVGVRNPKFARLKTQLQLYLALKILSLCEEEQLKQPNNLELQVFNLANLTDSILKEDFNFTLKDFKHVDQSLNAEVNYRNFNFSFDIAESLILLNAVSVDESFDTLDLYLTKELVKAEDAPYINRVYDLIYRIAEDLNLNYTATSIRRLRLLPSTSTDFASDLDITLRALMRFSNEHANFQGIFWLPEMMSRGEQSQLSPSHRLLALWAKTQLAEARYHSPAKGRTLEFILFPKRAHLITDRDKQQHYVHWNENKKLLYIVSSSKNSHYEFAEAELIDFFQGISLRQVREALQKESSATLNDNDTFDELMVLPSTEEGCQNRLF